jgi:uncharacterized protein YggU (UPF0235/DUF167 family)
MSVSGAVLLFIPGMKRFIILLAIVLVFGARHASAASSFSLVAPSGQLSRGQDVQFTINIDTAGETIDAAAMALRYDTAYLKYVGIQPGDATTSVSGTESSSGVVNIEAQSSAFSGTGTFAVITFNIIAEQSDSTQLCSISSATTTPTNSGSTTGGSTSTGSSARVSTLPQSGAAETTLLAVIAATFALSTSYILKRQM